MKFAIHLDNISLFRLAKWINYRKTRVQGKLMSRLLSGRDFIVWELPYGDRDAIKTFLMALRENFPPEFLRSLLLFVNPGNGGAYVAYLVGLFPETVMPYTRTMVNNIVGVAQTNQTNPVMLIALAIQGIFNFTINPSLDDVDAAFGTPEQKNRP